MKISNVDFQLFILRIAAFITRPAHAWRSTTFAIILAAIVTSAMTAPVAHAATGRTQTNALSTEACSVIEQTSLGAYQQDLPDVAPLDELDLTPMRIPFPGHAVFMFGVLVLLMLIRACVSEAQIRALLERGVWWTAGGSFGIALLWLVVVHQQRTLSDGEFHFVASVMVPAQIPIDLVLTGKSDNGPAGYVAESALAVAMRTSLNQGRLVDAERYADRTRSRQAPMHRESVYTAVASDAMQTNDMRRAFEAAGKAFAVDQSPGAQQVLNRVSAYAAMVAAEQGDFHDAQSILASLPITWADPLHANAIAHVARLQARNHLFVDNQPSVERLAGAADVLQTNYDRAQAIRSKPHDQLTCDLGRMLEMAGTWKLEENKLTAAIDYLSRSEKLVSSDVVSQDLLAHALHMRGLDYLAKESIRASIEDLQKSHRRVPDDQDVSCDLATATLMSGVNAAVDSQFNAARKTVREAQALCQLDSHRPLKAAIGLHEGEHGLRNGNFALAKRRLAESSSLKASSISARAAKHLNDLSQSQMRARALTRAHRWAAMPKWTGTVCDYQDNENKSGPCMGVSIMNGDTQVGDAPADFSHIRFRMSATDTILLVDVNGDRQYDVWQRDQGKRSHLMIEGDGDGRIDSEKWYVNEKLVKETQHSGHIMVRVVSAAIGKSGVDLLSEADAYLLVDMNQRRVGRTLPVRNSVYPSFQHYGFSLDFKHADALAIWMMDKDVWTADDEIDRFFYTGQLPSSGEYGGLLGHAAIELDVQPTTLPPGQHFVDGETLANVFRAPSRLDGADEFSTIIRAANAEKARAKLYGEVAAYTIPEIAAFSIFGSSRIAVQLGISILGYEVMTDINANAEDE